MRQALAGSLLLLTLGCEAEPTKTLAPTRGFILISIDTLRADHLSCYGYTRVTSPFIDTLAARGVLFENAFVQLPGTLPSHMSIFTGLYPAEHGVYPPDGVLSPEIPTLPEIFQANGFRTGGFTEGGYVDGDYGFARGFEVFSDRAGQVESDVEETFGRGLEFLEGLEDDEPFFLFLHTYSVHDPYTPMEPYSSLYWQGPVPNTFEPTGPNLVAVNRGELQITPRTTKYFESLYDGSINYVDDMLRQLFSDLARLRLSDQITLVLTSDHGEEFREHGRMVHQQVYPETLRVPLIFLHPGLHKPRRVQSLVESIDIAPTLLDIAGLAIPQQSGRSLVDLLLGGHEPEESQAYAESFVNPTRTVLRLNKNGFSQFLATSLLQSDQKPVWVSHSVSFDVASDEIRFRVSSYNQPRVLRVELNGVEDGSHEIRPDAWTTIEIAPPPGVPLARITLEADGCISPASLGRSGDARCLSFRFRGQGPLSTFELYDLRDDPVAQTNVFRRQPHVVRELNEILTNRGIRFDSFQTSRDLDLELQERLKAFGYLQ
ncbi:MAG: sulfatase [Thermoanaerobaculia bacterium]|jgi:arylsulfatase A-like enzyme